MQDRISRSSFADSQPARNRHRAAVVEAHGCGPDHGVGNSPGSAGLNAKLSPALRQTVNDDFTLDGMRALIGALTGDGFAIDEDLPRCRHERPCDPATYGAIMRWVKDQGGLFYADDYIRRVQTPTLVVNGKRN